MKFVLPVLVVLFVTAAEAVLAVLADPAAI